jgi:hypothetical protein
MGQTGFPPALATLDPGESRGQLALKNKYIAGVLLYIFLPIVE